MRQADWKVSSSLGTIRTSRARNRRVCNARNYPMASRNSVICSSMVKRGPAITDQDSRTARPRRHRHLVQYGNGRIEFLACRINAPDPVLDVITASGLLPAGTAVCPPADTNGIGLEMRYVV